MTSLINSRQLILESVLDLLWKQWSLLGVPGVINEGEEDQPSGDHRIIDPESLLLITSELGRYDARLFDEAINWLRQYGKLINIQRLKGIRNMQPLGNARVLASIAATLQENSRLAKWSAIEGMTEPQTGTEAVFKDLDGGEQPIFGEADPQFQKFGLFRGTQPIRQNAVEPKVRKPELILIKLRALLGVNARSEIIAALLSLHKAHPSALARRIAYLPRSVQDVLNEMALSGHVLTNKSPGSREKYFSLQPGDWSFLMTWAGQKYPQWIDWPVLYFFLQEAIAVLFSPELTKASPLMNALRLREVFDRHYPLLSEAGLGGSFQKADRETGMAFLEVFLAELKKF